MGRYAGKLTKLYPEDPFKALLVDEILGAIDDVNLAVSPSVHEPDEKRKVCHAGTSMDHRISVLI